MQDVYNVDSMHTLSQQGGAHDMKGFIIKTLLRVEPCQYMQMSMQMRAEPAGTVRLVTEEPCICNRTVTCVCKCVWWKFSGNLLGWGWRGVVLGSAGSVGRKLR